MLAADTLQQAFLHAPFAQDGWVRALRLFASLTGSSRAQLIGIGHDSAQFNLMTETDECYEKEFVAIGAHRPEINWRVAANAGTLEIISERDYDNIRSHLRSEEYDEHCRKWTGVYGAQTALLQSDHILIGLAVLRSEKDGRTTPHDRSVFAQGALYAQAAVLTQRAMHHHGAQLLSGALESLGFAAAFIDATGEVIALTPQAEDVLSAENKSPVYLRARKLVARVANSELHEAIECALRGLVSFQTLWIADPDSVHGLTCNVILLPRGDHFFAFEPRVLVILNAPKPLTQENVRPLTQAFGFTQAEIDITVGLANGLTRQEIADHRNASVNTLSTQIKAIFSKSGVRRESELVSLVNSLVRSHR